MNAFLRDFATPLSVVAFVAVGSSGMLLFFGIRNHTLFEWHEWLGVAFVVAAVLHLVRNWQGVIAMLSRPVGKAAAGLSAVAIVALLLAAQSGGQGGGQGGHFGPMSRAVVARLADAPIAKMAPALGLTSEEAIARLRRGGVAVEGVEGSDQSLNDIAAKQGAEPHRLMGLLVLTGPGS